jgi:hypothetical protein
LNEVEHDFEQNYLNFESFAVINLCGDSGVSTNKKYYMFYHHAILQRSYFVAVYVVSSSTLCITISTA